jgi:GTP-binding protein
MGNNRHGKDGKDLVIKVPPGTQVVDHETGEVLMDLVSEHKRYKALEGGIGGKGNAFFKSATNQTPQFAQPGMPGEVKVITLNLKLIADVGLVGLPNAGKSTLLSMITRAKPKIAAYPFTTLIPNLGVIQGDDGTVIKIADIPGIIEGAHRGHGLGLSFLQHIERVKIILFVIDATGEDPAYALELLKSELNTYNCDLNDRPYYVVLNKIDLLEPDRIKEKVDLLNINNIISVSCLRGDNMDRLVKIIEDLMEKEGAA